MTISILTIFPDMVREIMDYGVVGQAVKKGVLTINVVDLREFATDKHRSVDDKPFGGGPGMVLRVDIIDAAISNLKSQISNLKKTKVVLLSPQGKQFDQSIVESYAQLDHLILISGRYEGVDERVREHLVDEELSIGPYVLSGGEIPAMVVADAVARLVPGVVGDPESLINESFSSHQVPGVRLFEPEGFSEPEWPEDSAPRGTRHQALPFDFPHYTHPASYRDWKVPDVLRSGNHEEIGKWREEHRKRHLANSG